MSNFNDNKHYNQIRCKLEILIVFCKLIWYVANKINVVESTYKLTLNLRSAVRKPLYLHVI